LPTKTTSFSTK
jgi:hypothetical protein